MMHSYKYVLIGTISVLAVALFYQNCARSVLSQDENEIMSLSSASVSWNNPTIPYHTSTPTPNPISEPPPSIQAPEYQIRYADRKFVENVFIESTKNSDGSIPSNAINGINSFINSEKSVFIGSCDPYATNKLNTSFECTLSNNDAANMAPTLADFSSSRAALSIRLCSKLFNIQKILENALRNAGLEYVEAKMSDVDFAKTQKIYSLFYGDVEMPNELYLSLKQVAVIPGESKTSAYRNLIIAICSTPQWQLL